METALDLFVRQGFEDVTIDDICASAGVAKGTCYFHFPTKGALLAAGFQRSDDRIGSVVTEMVDAGVPFCDAVYNLGEVTAANTQRLPKDLVRRAALESMGHIGFGAASEQGDPRRIAMARLVEMGRDQAVVRVEVPTRDLVMTLGWAILHAILLWSSDEGDGPDLSYLVRNRLERSMHGIIS